MKSYLTPLRRLLMIAVILAIAVSLGTPVHAQNPVKLRFTVWVGPGAAMDMLKGIATAYTKLHPDVTVTFDTVAFTDYTTKITLQLAGSNPPDGGWILENSAPQFIASGVMTDLAPVLKAAPDYAFDDFEPSALSLWTNGDSVYGLPFSTSPFLIIYNADLFKAAGLPTPNDLAKQGKWTWQAFADSAKTIATTQHVYGFESVDANVFNPGGFWNTLTPMIRAYGGDAWDAKGTCQLNSPGAVAAIKLFHDMAIVDKSAVPPGDSGDFFSGKSAMTMNQISRVVKLDGAKFAWDLAPLPSGPAGDVATVGQAALTVFANSKNVQAAEDFLTFLTNKDNSATMSQFFPSARKSVLTSDAFLKSNSRLKPAQMQLVVDAIGKGHVLSSSSNFSQIVLATNPLFDQLWTDKADIQATMDQVCKAVTPLLNQ